ncbi:DUF2306 domain-containing protein [Aquimarina algicola]|uniref:DUF2306 domain-containing protein n=1 Tax=Aquimarina algicola TaxID=2589995 RepID=A0A504J8F8_9FLAO|nr:DUF2306 domain-containing protein [Aquimarina algicola]TPN83339.1 DUF2306 domain-containing protein [Aquimarina algicola]
MITKTKKYNVVLILLFIMSLHFISTKLNYFLLKEEVFDSRHWNEKWWLIGHLFVGIVVFFLGPFLFWEGFRKKYLKLHRLFGKIYLISIVLASFSASYIAWTASIKIHFTWAFSQQILSFTWFATAFMAYRAVKLHRIKQHKEWVVRSYIVTWGFIVFRWIDNYLSVLEIGTFVERGPTLIYTILFLSLFFYEIILQWNNRKPIR